MVGPNLPFGGLACGLVLGPLPSKGVCPGSFSKSLNRSCPKTFAEIRRRVVEHIASEGEAYEKCTTVAPTRPRAHMRTQPAKVHEVATKRKNQDRKRTYEARRTLEA